MRLPLMLLITGIIAMLMPRAELRRAYATPRRYALPPIAMPPPRCQLPDAATPPPMVADATIRGHCRQMIDAAATPPAPRAP